MYDATDGDLLFFIYELPSNMYRFWNYFKWLNTCKRHLHIGTTYLLTPWCRVLLEKLTGLQLVKKFPAFHGTRRFITALTSVRQLSLSWASQIQSTYPHPTSCRSILILSTHLRLGLPSGLFPSGFTTKTLYTPLHAVSYIQKCHFNWTQNTCSQFPVYEGILSNTPPMAVFRDTIQATLCTSSFCFHFPYFLTAYVVVRKQKPRTA